MHMNICIYVHTHRKEVVCGHSCAKQPQNVYMTGTSWFVPVYTTLCMCHVTLLSHLACMCYV